MKIQEKSISIVNNSLEFNFVWKYYLKMFSTDACIRKPFFYLNPPQKKTFISSTTGPNILNSLKDSHPKLHLHFRSYLKHCSIWKATGVIFFIFPYTKSQGHMYSFIPILLLRNLQPALPWKKKYVDCLWLRLSLKHAKWSSARNLFNRSL